MTCRSVTINESQRFQLINMLLNCCHRDTYFYAYLALEIHVVGVGVKHV